MSTQTPAGAQADGLASVLADGTVLDTWFPTPELGSFAAASTARLTAHELAPELARLLGADADRGVEVIGVRTTIADISSAPVDAYDAYLRLHLLSHRLVRPHGANMDGVFGL
ncbi:MAG: 2,3,4,5-tetrahydropyridine-2,6-dicarboxylate N-succinyltransferase, partial [Mycobacteriaceae bacterium]